MEEPGIRRWLPGFARTLTEEQTNNISNRNVILLVLNLHDSFVNRWYLVLAMFHGSYFSWQLSALFIPYGCS